MRRPRIRIRRRHVVAAAAGALLLFGASRIPPQPQPLATFGPATTCVARGPLPDPVCTPGARNPDVTQSTIGSTICVSGWTATVRPSVSYTDPLKVSQMNAYGFTGSTRDYEEDHLIPLELGGDPRDPRNLWPEPRISVATPGAENKDKLENELKREVCNGTMTLSNAQNVIATDWVKAWVGIGSP